MYRKLILLLFFALLSNSFSINISEVDVFNSSNPRSGGDFGYHVSIFDNYALIGARDENTSGFTNSGNAYLYYFSSGSWSLLQQINTTNPIAGGRFGYRTLMGENYSFVVGLYEESSGITGGIVYMYKLNQSNQQLTLVDQVVSPNNINSGSFGHGITMNDDYLVIGAPFESENTFYVYSINSTTDSLNLIYNVSSTNLDPSTFGYSIDINNENYIVVGDRSENDSLFTSGSIRLYYINETINNVTHLQTVYSTNPETGGEFGYSVAISSNFVLVGAFLEDHPSSVLNSGRVYAYRLSNNNLTLLNEINTPNPFTGGEFGIVAIEDALGLIGAAQEHVNGVSDSGIVYVIQYNSTSMLWEIVTMINSSNNEDNGHHGKTVGLYQGKIVVGAKAEDGAGFSTSGRTYFYNITGYTSAISNPISNLNQTNSIFPFFNIISFFTLCLILFSFFRKK